MTTEKILIAGGDSYTVHWQHLETPKSWATYLAESNGWKEVNVAKSGASCSKIFNSTIDAIEKYKDANPIVVVMWSEPMRVNFLDIVDIILECEDNLINHSKLSKSLSDQKTIYIEYISELTSIVTQFMVDYADSPDIVDAYEEAINSGLRYMYLLEEYCKLNNIEYYHGASISPLGGYNMSKTLSYAFDVNKSKKLIEGDHVLDIASASNLAISNIKKSRYYQYLEKSKSYMGFEYDSYSVINNNDLRISEMDHHPNNNGHKLLAQIIGKFIKDGQRINSNNNHYLRPVYIYD